MLQEFSHGVDAFSGKTFLQQFRNNVITSEYMIREILMKLIETINKIYYYLRFISLNS